MCSSDFKPKQTWFEQQLSVYTNGFLGLGKQVPTNVAVLYTSRRRLSSCLEHLWQDL